MATFFLTLMRLFSAIWREREDTELKALFQLLLLLLISGVAFYTYVKGWSFIDALYFSVITMATIGYGDLTPATTFDKVFTMFYALISVGVFVAVAAKIGAILLEKEQQQVRRKKEKKNGHDDAEEA